MTAPAPVQQGTWTADNLDHYVCCDENVALCGADVSAATWQEELPDLCLVCEDLDENDVDCPECGS